MARAAALAAVGSLGLLAALDPPFTRADPAPGTTATVYVTQTETRMVDRKIERRGVGWWRGRAVANRRALNRLGRRLDELRAERAARWAPTVRYGLRLARTVYGVDQTRRAFCESRFDVYARNASGSSGLLQFLPSTWASTPFGGFSIWDPVAQALAGGWMVAVAHRSGEWTCPLG